MYQIYESADSRWDEIVKSFENYDVYYLSGYVKAFELNGDGKACLFYCECGNTKAINVFMKRDVAECEHFAGKLEEGIYWDIVTPYGYGGFLIEGNEYDAVLACFQKFCKEQGIICEFVRFHPLLENWKGLESYYDIQLMGNTVCMDTRSEAIVWKNLTSKNRNMVRKAQKSGLRTYWGRNPQLILSFMEIYNQTMERDCASDYYFFKEAFYESVLEDLKQDAMWFYTMIEGEIASIAIFMFSNGNMHYHLSASRKEYQSLAPGNLMLYEAALWACNHGYKQLHMGGGVGSKEDSLYKFKKAFNREADKQFAIGRKIFDREKYDSLVRMRFGKEETAGSYFPLYRG